MLDLVVEYHYMDGDVGAYMLDEVLDDLAEQGGTLESEVLGAFRRNADLDYIVIRRLNQGEA